MAFTHIVSKRPIDLAKMLSPTEKLHDYQRGVTTQKTLNVFKVSSLSRCAKHPRIQMNLIVNRYAVFALRCGHTQTASIFSIHIYKTILMRKLRN
jgi:hypothetical protein